MCQEPKLFSYRTSWFVTTYEKVNEELFLDNPLHVIVNKSKLAYRIYVILIANKELKKVWNI
jgi:hypothetical protein